MVDRMRRRGMLALWVALAMALLLPSDSPARVSVLERPVGTASGTLRVTWTQILQAQQPRLIRTDGAITFTIEDRLRASGAAEAWITEELPDFARMNVRKYYGYLLRARLTVDRFNSTADYVCEDGSAVRTTTVVTEVTQPHALLTSSEPTLNLPRHAGTADLQLDDETQREGPTILQHAVIGTGAVATRTSGADCSGYDDQGRMAPQPVDRADELSLARLLGGSLVVSIIASPSDQVPVRVVEGGAIVMDRPAPLLYQGTHAERESIDGEWTPDVRFGGPPHAQRALCELPTVSRMARVRSLAAVRTLLRRYGIPETVYGGRKHNAAPAGTFFLTSSSGEAFCGATLGSRKFPGLYRSSGIGR